jgi:hypothetical protein
VGSHAGNPIESVLHCLVTRKSFVNACTVFWEFVDCYFELPNTTAKRTGRVTALSLAPSLPFIADRGNNRIGKVSDGAIIAPIAGSRTDGFSGEGGTAACAEFNGSFGFDLWRVPGTSSPMTPATSGSSTARAPSPRWRVAGSPLAGAGMCSLAATALVKYLFLTCPQNQRRKEHKKLLHRLYLV